VRFTPIDRAIYLIVFASILGLIFTGLPLKYGYQPWAQRLAHRLGGFESTSTFHHFFAGALLCGVVVHVTWSVKRVIRMYRGSRGWKQLLFGPDSMLPNLRDLKDLLRMVRWFFGLGPKPVFERWTYWEKLDFLAVHVAVVLIATSGLMLWYPNVFCLILPGKVLNLAKVVHAESALLIASFIIIIHLFNMHFRPEKFPMDLSFLTGLTSEDHMRIARPQFLERMAQEGKLDDIRVIVPPGRQLWPRILLGAVIFALGVALVVILLIASMGK
jgi:cytochrome b subunit of formate dehydrogenase